MDLNRVVEQIIRNAQEEGKFDNLRGKGRPINWDENPFGDPAWEMAHHLLKENGFRPDWLEDDLALREKLAQARKALARTHDWRAAELERLGAREDAPAKHQRLLVADEWNRALENFRRSIDQINAKIPTLNLKVPHERFQRVKLVLADELQRVLEPESK
jgi:DnaJ family protein C protein 28